MVAWALASPSPSACSTFCTGRLRWRAQWTKVLPSASPYRRSIRLSRFVLTLIDQPRREWRGFFTKPLPESSCKDYNSEKGGEAEHETLGSASRRDCNHGGDALAAGCDRHPGHSRPRGKGRGGGCLTQRGDQGREDLRRAGQPNEA